MASIHRRVSSPYFWGAYTMPSGKRRYRSTKCKKRSDALRVVIEWESAARRHSTEAQIRRVFSDIHREIHGTGLASASVTDFAERWKTRKVGETSKATLAAYKRAVDDFVLFLGDRAHADLASVTPAEVAECRDRWAESSSPKTVNNKLKAVRAMFNSAWRETLIIDNPAAKVAVLKEEDVKERRPFTLPELRTILEASNQEWRGVILAGFTTGQRIGDIVQLRWPQVDLVVNEIKLTTGKTKRRQIIPLSEQFRDWLIENAGDDTSGPLFPQCHEKFMRGGTSTLSKEFHLILCSVGMAKPRTIVRDKTGPGRRARRERGELTFHSLRHTTTSLLKASGTSEAVAMDIVGHDSAEVSQLYTHTSEQDKRAAISKLPRL